MSERPLGHLAIASPSLWLTLALLIEKPNYAAGVRREYDKQFGLFAPARGQADFIRRLEQLNLVHALPRVRSSDSDETRRGRTYFEATTNGEDAHRRWLVGQLKDEHWRIELLARIATGACLGTAGLLRLVNQYQQFAVAEARFVESRVAEQPEAPQDIVALVDWLVMQELRLILASQRQWSQFASHAIHEHHRKERQ